MPFAAMACRGQLLADNGPPWGSSHSPILTRMDVWLLRLGVRPLHGRPLHPQTQGKIERFHRTLTRDVLQQPFDSPAQAQVALDAYRVVYNHERPHSALGFRTPADCYRLSPRPFPEQVPPILYDDAVPVRRVSAKGTIRYQNRVVFLSEALQGFPVGSFRRGSTAWSRCTFAPGPSPRSICVHSSTE